jgi:hypothetical protein
VFSGEYYFVYKDKRGVTHIEDSIPGELTKYGYKIVNDKGVILKEIPSVSAKLKRANANRRLSEAQRAKLAQRQKNQTLLRRFTGLEDIRETGNKKIMALQSQIDLTLSHIAAFEKNLAELESQVAQSRKKLLPVSSDSLRAIERMKENIQENKKYVEQRKLKQHETREEFIQLIHDYKRIVATK